MNPQPNIVFIIMDAVRARNLSCYGYSKPTSPNIDKLAKEGILFENAFSCINTTDSSLTSIFSGMYPRTHGIIHQGDTITADEINRFLGSGIKLFPEILKENGYITLGVDWMGRWHKRGYDYYMGIRNTKKKILKAFFSKFAHKLFENPRIYKFIKIFYEKRKSINVEWETADELTKVAIDLIKKTIKNEKEKPFFIFIHYWDTHIPYNAPSECISKLGSYKPLNKTTDEILSEINNPARVGYLKGYFKENVDVSEIIKKYDGAIRYVDYQIGKIINVLEDLGILDDTIIIITSDHGESLIEHGIYFDHHGLYDVSVHVPLIIRYPDKLPENVKVKGLVQHIDLLPTLLSLLNIETNIKFDGLNLLPLINGEVDKIRDKIFLEEAYAQRRWAIRTERYKYIFANNKEEAFCKFCGKIHGDLEELFDLYTDPEEDNNILEDYPDIYYNLKLELKNWIKDTENIREMDLIRSSIRKIKHKL